jgi:PBSX family phage terminase large subunit
MSLSNSFTFSPKQAEFMANSNAKINIAYGAVRGGKTFASLIRFVELVLQCPNNEIIMVGNMFSSVVVNAVMPIKDVLFRGYCTWSNHILSIGDKKIRVIGAHDEGSVRAIQGNTHSLAYVDEMTTIPVSFLDMLTTRLSYPHSKLIGTCNPGSPLHPIKINMIDNPDRNLYYSCHFEIDDNPMLDEAEKIRLRTQYTGLFYKRYILGQWVMAEGAIFPDFDVKIHVIDRAPTSAEQYYVGIDYGASNPTAAVMVGYRSGHTPRFWVEKEYYWDSKANFRAKTNGELADDIEQFIEGYNVRGIFLDPSAASFKVELQRHKVRPLIEADNDVFPGITFVANLISNHQLKVLSCCRNLIHEMGMYVWDAKAALKGIEQPVKSSDHAVDALRYALYSAFGKKMSMDLNNPDKRIPPSEREDLRGYGFR